MPAGAKVPMKDPVTIERDLLRRLAVRQVSGYRAHMCLLCNADSWGTIPIVHKDGCLCK